MKNALLATLVLLTPAAWAQDGLYLGAAIGQARIKNTCQGAPPGFTCDGNDTAFKFFGGYAFTRRLAAEFGIASLGTAEAGGGGATQKADLSAVELSAVGSLPVGSRFALFGRLGVFVGEMETTTGPVVAIFPPPPSRGWTTETHTGVTFGLGASYDVKPRARLRVEWQRYPGFGGSGAPKLDVDVVSLGALYRFGE